MGPTVATLSLGANATMNFRPKKKTCIPLLQEGNVRGRGRGKGIISDDARVNDTKNKSENPAVLSIKLEHGDIVIMHGREIQKLFEVIISLNLAVYKLDAFCFRLVQYANIIYSMR